MELKDNFIGKEFPQNCGDSLFVLEKTKIRKNGSFLYECEFQKYPYKLLAFKDKIIKGSVNNPQIEQVEFIDKIWPQNCGDDLKIIRKSDKKNYWECEFIKYPYKILALKHNIIKGFINNPQIEQVEFIGKIFPQNCGDSLKVIRKTEQKYQNNCLYECEFQKYPYKVFVLKIEIIKKSVLNPQIEQVEFIDKIWPQKCGDSLKIIRKSNKLSNRKYLWECEFIKYPHKCLASKENILSKKVENFNLPWKIKESLISYIQENFKNKKPNLTELSKALDIAPSTIGQKINEFGLREYISYSYNNLESEIREYVNNLNIDINNYYTLYSDDNKQYEIDIFILSKNIGIEVNGSYWHSELYKDYLYHQNKSLLAKDKGIDLIHIFEYEWKNEITQNIIKSLIQSKLGIFIKKIYARKCVIKKIDSLEYANFCNENHLQGSCSAKIKLGLFYKDELVQIMSFSLPRFTDKYEWEIIRECSKLGFCIIGGKEKLWKYFLKKYNPSNCLSYCDFSKFTGDSYLKLGFQKERLNKPGFVWYDENTKQTFWRNPYKHREMKEAGYLRIFDAGQLVFVWKK
jgi:DNA-directed RNA polymerase subunit H (RpoH/RPB5)